MAFAANKGQFMLLRCLWPCCCFDSVVVLELRIFAILLNLSEGEHWNSLLFLFSTHLERNFPHTRIDIFTASLFFYFSIFSHSFLFISTDTEFSQYSHSRDYSPSTITSHPSGGNTHRNGEEPQQTLCFPLSLARAGCV